MITSVKMSPKDTAKLIELYGADVKRLKAELAAVRDALIKCRSALSGEIPDTEKSEIVWNAIRAANEALKQNQEAEMDTEQQKTIERTLREKVARLEQEINDADKEFATVGMYRCPDTMTERLLQPRIHDVLQELDALRKEKDGWEIAANMTGEAWQDEIDKKNKELAALRAELATVKRAKPIDIDGLLRDLNSVHAAIGDDDDHAKELLGFVIGEVHLLKKQN